MLAIFYILMAALGIGFLIFIHELGHYLMAKRVGMKVETFSIGFGKAIYEWKRGDEVWKIGWLPFGGYIRIAGMEMTDDEGPEAPDTFFAKSPWDRIKVAFAGPLVNLLFAFLAFSLIWAFGGREKSFSEHTAKIGWVDPNSELYQKGVRPGDEITAYDQRPFTALKDHVAAPMMAGEMILVEGNYVDYQQKAKLPFSYKVETYTHPFSLDNDRKTAGVILPAGYVIYRDMPGSILEDPTVEGSPLYNSGIQVGDRIVWVDGERIYSLYQLSQVLNDDRVLATIQRGNRTLLRRIPRVKVEELRLPPSVKEELVDWQYESGNSGKKLGKMYALAYDITQNGVVESRNRFIDQETEREFFREIPYSEESEALQVGDKIVAIGGDKVSSAFEIFGKIQQRKSNIIVQRNPESIRKTSSTEAEISFERDINSQDLAKLTALVGSQNGIKESGDLILLKPVIPIRRDELRLSPQKQALVNAEIAEQKEAIDSIENPEKRAQAQELFQQRNQQLMLGLAQEDRKVVYNPNPLEQFVLVYEEIWATLSSLVTGNLHPKFLAGPIGMVQIAQASWGVSLNEVLFWLGAISLNLGFLNLLPIPVLDGGYIVIFLVEIITRKRIRKKTLEKLIIPFVVLLVGLFFYATYNDISRIFGGFFNL